MVYIHIGRGLYYGSYRYPRSLLWIVGVVIFILMMAEIGWPNWGFNVFKFK
jgi:ubiquinol-cytochrome c reductase cytochrome b subunit